MKIKGLVINYLLWLHLTAFMPFGLQAVEANDEKNSHLSWGIIPVVSFDADLGLRYGAVVNLFDYGGNDRDGKYRQYLFLRLTNTTLGARQAQAIFESNSLIPNAYSIAELSYLDDKKLDFFGFNGRESLYNRKFAQASDNGGYFYAYERRLLRLRMDVQHLLPLTHLRLLTGFTFERYAITDPIKNSQQMPGGKGLYGLYHSWGLIPEDEAEGGNLSLFRLGLVYDSRNDLCYCTDGHWVKAIISYAPPLLNKNGFARIALSYRRHQSWLNEKLTLSYRLSFQQSLFGKVPFYSLPFYYDSRLSQDGLGGAFSLRGALRNRIVAEGFALGNLEFKYKVLQTKLFKQSVALSPSVFYDNALVTKKRQLSFDNIPLDQLQMHFDTGAGRFHQTLGLGLYIIINKDNIISLNYGKPLNPADGPGGLYVGSSLLF